MGSGRKLAIFESQFGRGASSALKLASPNANYGDALGMTQGAAGRAAATAKQMDDNLGGVFRRMMSAVEGVAIAVGDALAGPLGGLADKIGEIAGKVTQFVGENKELVVSIAKGAAAAVAIGAGMVAAGTAIVGVGTVLGGLAGITSAVATAFGAVASVIGALLSPIGLVSAAVVGLPAIPSPPELRAAASAGMGGKGSVAGSFSALALAGMGRGNAADRTAKVTEESAGHLPKLVKGQKANRFVFTGDASPL